MPQTVYEHKKVYQLEEIKRLVNKGLKPKVIRLKLGVSKSNFYNLLKQVRDNEFKLIHGLRGRPSLRKIDPRPIADAYIKNMIEINNLRNDENYRVTNTDFYHLSNFDFSFKTLNNLLLESLIYSPVAYKSTKRNIRKKIKQLNKKEVSKEIIKINKLTILKENKPYIGKSLSFGTVVELDTCQHQWVNKEKFHIYHAIDAQTGMLLAVHIEKEETTLGYYKLLRKLFSKYGKCQLIKTDKRRTFWGTTDTQTLMGDSLKEIGVELICDSSPTFKANVERSFSNAQKFYPLLFFKMKITKPVDLYDNHDWLCKEYNQRFKKEEIEDSLFEPISEEMINRYICPKQKVKVLNGNYISFEGKPKTIINHNGMRLVLKPRSYLIVHQNMDNNELFTIYNNKVLRIVELSPDLIFEDEYFKIESAWEKLKNERVRISSINRSINTIQERKQRKIDESIAHNEFLLKRLKRNGIKGVEV